MDTSFAVQDHFPSIYKITLDNHRELLDLYTDILRDTPAGQVARALAHHVTQSIEPTDWTGIWRATVVQETSVTGSSGSGANNQNANPQPTGTKRQVIKCDFEVEVIDVTHNTLDAVVIIRKLLSPISDRLTTSQFDAIDSFMKEKVRTIPLWELYVISESDGEEERLLPTAVVIEQIRFFHKFIQRPWDDLVSDSRISDTFSTSKLEPRLTLYFDIKQKLLPESTIKKVAKILSEGKKLRKQFDAISRSVSEQQEKLDNKNTCGDEEGEENGGYMVPDSDLIDETEFYQAMRLKLKLEDLQRQMEMIEDPYMRLVATTGGSMGQEGLGSLVDEGEEDEPDVRRIHVLAQKVTKQQLDLVNTHLIRDNETETELKFHKTLGHVLRSCRSGDKVFVLPGSYVCDSLPWIECDVEIRGLSNRPEDVVLMSSDAIGDVFINCSSNAILMQNLTIRTPVETQSVVMVHSGVTDLVNCVVDGGRVARNTLVALSKADVAMDNCRIIHKGSVAAGPAVKSPTRAKVTGVKVKKTSPDRMGISRRAGGNVSIDGTSLSMIVDNDDDGEADCEENELLSSCDATVGSSSQQSDPRNNHINDRTTTTRLHLLTTDDEEDSDAMSVTSEVKILNTMCSNLPKSIRSDYC